MFHKPTKKAIADHLHKIEHCIELESKFLMAKYVKASKFTIVQAREAWSVFNFYTEH